MLYYDSKKREKILKISVNVYSTDILSLYCIYELTVLVTD